MSYETKQESAALRAALAPFEHASGRASLVQLATTLVLFAAICAAMYWMIHVSYLLALVLALPAAGLLTRIFIFQHDCGHGAFFATRRANDLVGLLCGILTLTPYANWRRQHAQHHGNWNNLDRRASGADIFGTCLTVKEYHALSFWQRAFYRHLRNPILAHLLLPPVIFAVLYRLPFDTPAGWHVERRAVYVTNACLTAVVLALGLWLGFLPVLMVQAPIVVLGSIIGVWLFAVQHRFDASQWSRGSEWSLAGASMRSTSYLRLPAVLAWFTGNIGFHHVHHLAPRVPNYRLRACHEAIPALHAVSPLTFWPALRSIRLALWDEDRGRLIGFRDLPAKT